jgi:hypothetical protein
MALMLGGCSNIELPWNKIELPWNKEEREAKAAAAKMAALRARTDSLRKARRIADSIAVVRHAACVDSMRAVLSKQAAAARKSGKRKRAPSPELIATQAQTTCEQITAAPQSSVATRPDQAARDGSKLLPGQVKTSVATAKTAAPAARDTAAPPARRETVARVAPSTAQAAPTGSMTSLPGDQAFYADSVRRAKEMEMARETFAYSGGTRDPFASLLNLAKDGPELAELQLVGIYQNLRTPRGSIAVFRERDGGKRHKLRAGDQLGRSRLIEIRERDVVFVIEDFGFERQETLSLRKQEDVAP